MARLLRVRTTINYLGGGPGLSTTYHLGSAVPLLSEAQAAADRVRASWDVVKTLLPGTVTIQVQAAVDVLDETNGVLTGSFAVTQPALVTGTAAGGLGPPQVMAGLVLSTSSVVDRRRLRGRLFIGPLAATQTASPTPPISTQTAVNAMGVALLTITPPSVTAPLAVWHRPVVTPAGTVTRAGLAQAALSSTTALKWFTLRSRLN